MLNETIVGVNSQMLQESTIEDVHEILCCRAACKLQAGRGQYKYLSNIGNSLKLNEETERR